MNTDPQTFNTTTARIDLANARAQVREYAADIDTLKLAIRDRVLSEAGGDLKALGGNEAQRSDAYERAYAANEVLQGLIKGQRVAQHGVDELAAHLDGLADEMRAWRAIVDARRTDVLMACVERLSGVTLESTLAQAGAA